MTMLAKSDGKIAVLAIHPKAESVPNPGGGWVNPKFLIWDDLPFAPWSRIIGYGMTEPEAWKNVAQWIAKAKP